VEEGDLVLLEQVLDAVVVLLDDVILAGNHLGHIHADLAGRDAVVRKMQIGVLEMLGRLQQCLGRNATDVGAGAAQCRAAGCVLPLVDTCHLHAQLGCTDGRYITAGAAADHDDIKLLAHD